MSVVNLASFNTHEILNKIFLQFLINLATILLPLTLFKTKNFIISKRFD